MTEFVYVTKNWKCDGSVAWMYKNVNVVLVPWMWLTDCMARISVALLLVGNLSGNYVCIVLWVVLVLPFLASPFHHVHWSKDSNSASPRVLLYCHTFLGFVSVGKYAAWSVFVIWKRVLGNRRWTVPNLNEYLEYCWLRYFQKSTEYKYLKDRSITRSLET